MSKFQIQLYSLTHVPTHLPLKQGLARHRPNAHQILNISDTVYCLLLTYTVYHLLSTVYSLLSPVYYVN